MSIDANTNNLEPAAVKAVADHLNEAIEKGRRQRRDLSRAVQHDVSRLVHRGPRHLPHWTTVVFLVVLMFGGITGAVWSVLARNWLMCALLLVLTTIGVFLLDQVHLMQRRDNALKVGLYLAAKDAVPNSDEQSQNVTKL